MLQRLRDRASEDKGFTLIELLVVILIIGILAAIALPTFLGQQEKGQDSSAKSDARNLVSHIESCYVDEQSYVPCTNDAGVMQDTGLALEAVDGATPAAGKVSVMFNAAGGYVITAKSKSNKNFFAISKNSGTGAITRTCGAVAPTAINTGATTVPGTGGCKSDGTW